MKILNYIGVEFWMSNANNATNSPFSRKSILEKDKLNNSNFIDWYRNLKIDRRAKNKFYALNEPILDELVV